MTGNGLVSPQEVNTYQSKIRQKERVQVHGVTGEEAGTKEREDQQQPRRGEEGWGQDLSK